MERRLATILAADVAGYTREMERDEAGTLRRLKALRALVQAQTDAHGARVVNWAGDGLIAEFQSPVSAVRAGFDLQRELGAAHHQESIGLVLRVGVHLADVYGDGADLLGDGVNIASRIETEATPSEVWLSRAVLDQVKRTAQLKFRPVGPRRLKNISEPVELYAVVGELGPHAFASGLDAAGGEIGAFRTEAALRPNGVVVVPFENQSTDEEQEYFADGVTEDLITELSRFGGLFVIARNASFALKGKRPTVRQVCEGTGVRNCLEGGIRRLGQRVRLTCHLTDGETCNRLWSERFDFTLDDLFDVQDEIVARIASAVAGRVERQAEESARRKPTEDMEAYDCLLRGLHYHRIGGVTLENAEQAVAWFEKALEKDPRLGRGYAWLACATATRDEWRGVIDETRYWELGRRGLELDDQNAEVHRIMGSLSLYSADFDRALFHFNRALEITPNHANLVAHVGNVHNYMGDGKTGLSYQRRAEALDPFLPEYCREVGVIAHYVLEDWNACVSAAEAFPRPTRRSCAYRAAAALHLDDGARLERALRRLSIVDPGFDPVSLKAAEVFLDPARNARFGAELDEVAFRMPRARLHAAI